MLLYTQQECHTWQCLSSTTLHRSDQNLKHHWSPYPYLSSKSNDLRNRNLRYRYFADSNRHQLQPMVHRPCHTFVTVSPFRPIPSNTISIPLKKVCMLASELPPVRYGRIQHAGVLVKDTALSKTFYMDVFGMEDDDALRNPKLPFKGSFLKAGSSQIHLMELPSPDPEDGRPHHGGRDRHVAVTVKNLDPLISSLEKHGRHFTFSKSGRRAVFTRDLDANAIEFIEDSSA